METEFRNLPGVDRVMTDERLGRFGKTYSHDLLVSVVRQRLAVERAAVAAGRPAASLDDIITGLISYLEGLDMPLLRRVINAAGIIIHTNLGRAPLSPETLAAMDFAGAGFSNLEYNLEKGVRGSRYVHVEELLCCITGAEAALVVNNNASGVLLGLSAMAARREVIVSRGQAVEIGGGFRIPDVMRQSGAKLVEVGTTNRTYARDFDEAVTDRTVALMRVHSSNFKLVGFVSEPTLDDITGVAVKRGLLVLDDLGSGALLDTAAYGLNPEPMVQQSVAAGAGLVFFSGDKLIGGPQAGIIVGRKEYVDKLKKHPLARAVRMDKSRLAGLAATLRHYLHGEAVAKIPVWRMIAMPLEDIEKRAKAWAAALGNADVVDGETLVGGGSLPGSGLPTRLVARGGNRQAVQQLAKSLRSRETPVVGRINEDVFLLDPRTVLPEEDPIIIEALRDVHSP